MSARTGKVERAVTQHTMLEFVPHPNLLVGCRGKVSNLPLHPALVARPMEAGFHDAGSRVCLAGRTPALPGAGVPP